ncbi:MAG: prepilin-type N-terminal cleavage/methylation domain-containing protein [Terriglobales bacterium]
MPPLPSSRSAERQPGFSLVEMLLALTLLLMISAIAFAFISRYSQRYGAEMQASNLSSAGSRALSDVLLDLRMAGYPEAPQTGGLLLFPKGGGLAYTGSGDNMVAQGFSNISANGQTFTAALGNRGAVGAGGTVLDQDGLVVDQVQFTLAPMPAATAGGCAANPQLPGSSLWELRRTVAPEDATGTPQLPAAPLTDPWPFDLNPSTVYSTVVDDIVSPQGGTPSIFTYFDASGAQTADPASVAQVKVAFTLQTCEADRRTGLPIQLPFSGAAFVRNSGQ